MASLNVNSLFTNIPLIETNICIDSLYKNDENIPKIPEDVFHNLLTVATKESLIMFNNKFYKQTDGVAMKSPLGSAVANIFKCRFGKKWLKDCPHSLKLVFYVLTQKVVVSTVPKKDLMIVLPYLGKLSL